MSLVKVGILFPNLDIKKNTLFSDIQDFQQAWWDWFGVSWISLQLIRNLKRNLANQMTFLAIKNLVFVRSCYSVKLELRLMWMKHMSSGILKVDNKAKRKSLGTGVQETLREVELSSSTNSSMQVTAVLLHEFYQFFLPMLMLWILLQVAFMNF